MTVATILTYVFGAIYIAFVIQGQPAPPLVEFIAGGSLFAKLGLKLNPEADEENADS